MDFTKDLLRDLGLAKSHNLLPRQILRLLAAAQGGQFSTRQAVALGIKPTQVLSLRHAGEIASLRRNVWRFLSAAAEPDVAVTAFLACWPHAVISHASAARYHGLTRVAAPAAPEVTAAHGTTCRPDGVVVHRTRSLENGDILRVGTLRYTSVARTVCDLADAKQPWETLSLVDDAVASGAKPRWINQVATELMNGRNGVSMVERATRPGASSEFRSWLERAGGHVFVLGGLPLPLWNVEIRDGGGRIGIVDALWLPQRVVCELKGLRFHTTPAQLRRDDHRANRLLDAAYNVRSVSWRDLVDNPTDVVATVMRAMRAAGATVDLGSIPQSITIPKAPFL